MQAQTLIIGGVSFLINMSEALLYYNLGNKSKTGKFTYRIPPGKELFTTAAVVLISSSLVALSFRGIELALTDTEMDKNKA